MFVSILVWKLVLVLVKLKYCLMDFMKVFFWLGCCVDCCVELL